MYTSVNDLNNYIATLPNKYNLEDYFRLIHSYFYNEIDISLMNKFLNYTMNSDIYCVETDTLVEFGLLKNKSDVQKFIKDYRLTEEVDYIIINPPYAITVASAGSKEYKFTAFASKICIMLSGNPKYIKYFLLIESMFYYYKEYEKLYNDNNQKNNNMITQLNTINESICELNIKSSLGDLNTCIISLNDKLHNMLNDSGYTDILESIKILSENITSILIRNNTLDSKIAFISEVLEGMMNKTNETYLKCDDIDVLLDKQMAQLQSQNISLQNQNISLQDQILSLQSQNRELQSSITDELRFINSQLSHINKNTTTKERWYKRMFHRHDQPQDTYI